MRKKQWKKNTHTLAPDNSAFPSTFCFSHGVFIVCTPSLSALGGGGGGREEEGVEPSTKFSKREGFTGPQFLEGGCWERGGWPLWGAGGCNLYVKNKLDFRKI